MLGQWPWPRTRVADLVTRLTKLGAIVIAFDVIFSEPDRLSPQIAAEVFHGLDDETRLKLRALPSNDQVMADALRQSRVVLGETGLPSVVAADSEAPPVGIAMLGGDPRPFLYNFPGLLRNIPILEKSAVGRGLFTIKTERDGIIRRVPIVMEAQGQILPSLTFETLRAASGGSTILIRTDTAGIKSVAVPGFEVPTDRNGQLWVYFAPHDPARFVSAIDVLNGRVGPEKITGKLVLIGTSAAGLNDLKTTPVDPTMPGVEVHAQVLESMLTQSVLSRPNYAIAVELGAALLIGIMIVWLVPILGPVFLLAMVGFIITLLVGTSWFYYTHNKVLIDFTYPLLSSLLIYLTLDL